MPGYVSHTIMARDVYNKLKDKKINLDHMLTFSLGGDLTKFAKCRYATHHTKQEEFISKMYEYIKKNNLTADGEVLGVLYGHICHYQMDKIMHPLVYKIDKSCLKNKKNHTLIEGYIDNYLVNYKYHYMVNKYNSNEVFKGQVNKKISKMLDTIYLDVYNCKRISIYYKINIWLYKKIKYLYKIFGIKFLKKIYGYNKFRNNNQEINLSTNIINNYNESINEAYKYIIKKREITPSDTQ